MSITIHPSTGVPWITPLHREEMEAEPTAVVSRADLGLHICVCGASPGLFLRTLGGLSIFNGSSPFHFFSRDSGVLVSPTPFSSEHEKSLLRECPGLAGLWAGNWGS